MYRPLPERVVTQVTACRTSTGRSGQPPIAAGLSRARTHAPTTTPLRNLTDPTGHMGHAEAPADAQVKSRRTTTRAVTAG